MDAPQSTQASADSLPDIKALGPGPKRERKQPTTAQPLGDSATAVDSDPGAAGGAQTAVMERPAKRKRKTGRRGKLNPRRMKAICRILRRGGTLPMAAEACGVDPSTAMRWVARGCDETEGPYRRFRNAVKRSEAIGDAKAISRITLAGEKGIWTADAWRLERRRRAEYGKKELVEHTGSIQHAHAVAITYVNCDTLQAGELAKVMELYGRMLEQPAIETTAVPVANIEHKPDAQ